jgi:GTP-binding protein
MAYRVLLLGRANVGKSSIFNALLGFRRSIVFGEPGTTREIVSEPIDWGRGRLWLCDSQGFFSADDTEWIRSEVQKSNAVLLVVDASSGVSPFDRDIAEILRRAAVPTLLVVNKSDVRGSESHATFAELGLESLETSAVHSRGIDAVREWINNIQEQSDSASPSTIRLAIIGRPNTGKSTLLNRLARQKLARTSPSPLTTTDPILAEIEHKGQTFKIVDTAGIRRPRSSMDPVEKFSVAAAIKNIEKADVVFLVVAADEPATDQDMRLLSLLERQAKPTLVLLNRWDKLSRAEQRELWAQNGYKLRRFESLPISAKTGYNLNRLLPLATNLMERSASRISTAKLNQVIRELVTRTPPPAMGTSNFNILYASQVRSRPPTFVFFMNRKTALPNSYKTYLANELRKRLNYQGQPLRLFFRAR